MKRRPGPAHLKLVTMVTEVTMIELYRGLIVFRLKNKNELKHQKYLTLIER